MSPSAKRLLTGVLAVLVAAAAGCGQDLGQELVKFNDKIAESNRKLAGAAWKFRQSVFPLSKSEPVNSAELKRSYDALAATLNQIKEERRTAKPPSVTAEPLHKAYDEFLQGQERLVQKEFVDILQLAENSALQAKDRWTKITAVINEVEKQERAERQKLSQAQSKFSTDANMRIVTGVVP